MSGEYATPSFISYLSGKKSITSKSTHIYLSVNEFCAKNTWCPFIARHSKIIMSSIRTWICIEKHSLVLLSTHSYMHLAYIFSSVFSWISWQNSEGSFIISFNFFSSKHALENMLFTHISLTFQLTTGFLFLSVGGEMCMYMSEALWYNCKKFLFTPKVCNLKLYLNFPSINKWSHLLLRFRT